MQLAPASASPVCTSRGVTIRKSHVIRSWSILNRTLKGFFSFIFNFLSLTVFISVVLNFLGKINKSNSWHSQPCIQTSLSDVGARGQIISHTRENTRKDRKPISVQLTSCCLGVPSAVGGVEKHSLEALRSRGLCDVPCVVSSPPYTGRHGQCQ